MTEAEHAQISQILNRIPKEAWDAFLGSPYAKDMAVNLHAAREALRQNYQLTGPVSRPTEAVVTLLGRRVLSDKVFGSWAREQLLRELPATKWQKLFAEFPLLTGVKADLLHGNMAQVGKGSQVMARYWHQGGRWARRFCEVVGLPAALAARESQPAREDEEVVSVVPLAPLHDFQEEVYRNMRKLLEGGMGKAAALSLPTGAGKTRVTVEAVCDHLAQGAFGQKRNVMLWIAQSEELLMQAWECFRQVWQAPPQRKGSQVIRRPVPLNIVRLWGNKQELELGEGPTIVIGGIQKMKSAVERGLDGLEGLYSRLGAVVIDETHKVVNEQHADVLRHLGLRKARAWETCADAPPVLGLTSTPWRTRSKEDESLRRYFSQRLIRPEVLGDAPIATLQKRGILSHVEERKLSLDSTERMTEAQLARFKQFHEVPEDFLAQLGLNPRRNAEILDALAKLPQARRTLVFACSVAHAEIMALLLNQACGEGTAAVVSSQTPRSERAAIIGRFREGKDNLRFLCNVDVLTTGFDAPKVDVVCMTRPTASAIRYEQMVGRGLRGPKNGGTETCIVMDVQDEGLPAEVLSYGRVAGMWGKRR